MQSPGRVFSRAQLLDGVWGRNVYVDERTVDVHIGRLRKALDARPRDGSRPHRARRGLRLLRQAGRDRLKLSAPVMKRGARRGASPHALATRRLTRSEALLAPPRLHRLIGHARMVLAIGQTPDRLPPQKWNSGSPGSPIGQRHIASFRLRMLARSLSGMTTPRRRRHRLDLHLVCGRKRRVAARRRRAGTRIMCEDGAAARPRRGGRAELVARPDSPSRCTLPITALRVTPPSARNLACAQALQPKVSSAVQPSRQSNPWFGLLVWTQNPPVCLETAL